MMRFKWNALRSGDKVLVHDPGSAGLTLVPGTVAAVDTHKSVNGVGIRLAAVGDQRSVVWPSYMAVHRDPRDRDEACWRCQALTGS